MRILFFFFLFLVPALPKAQDFNYVHYDTKDGLAGSTVYSMCQDKDGFMWFGTENGLSRYDGTHFKNFTVKDGLPDNEVLKVFADSKGRVWIGTFSKEICYYYQGKIHNKNNDSLMIKLKLNGNLSFIVEDSLHFLGISDNSFVKIISPEDNVFTYKLADFCPDKYIFASILTPYEKIRLELVLKSDSSKYFQFNPRKLAWESFTMHRPESSFKANIKKDSFSIPVFYDNNKKTFLTMFFPGNVISENDKNGKTQFVYTSDGAWEMDTIKIKRGNHYLQGKKISWTIVDHEKNLWFSSLGEGVYKLPSKTVKSFIPSNGNKNNKNEIFSIIGFRKRILAGEDRSLAKFVDWKFKEKEFSFKGNEVLVGTNINSNRLYSMVNISDSVIVFGFDRFLVKLKNEKPTFNYIFPVKSVAKINNDFIIAGTSSYAFKVRLKDMKVTDTLWRERCTKVFYHNNKYYIGTLNGLYEVNEDKSYSYLGNVHPVLKRRITDIKDAADSSLWISTSDNGIVALKDGKIIYAINDTTGLSSNICKTLFIKGSTIWVGTDKGINKIDIVNGQYHIIKYSTSDGLPSNVINAIYVKDTIVWVGSPAGLTYFNENSISSSSMCNLKLMGITVSGKEVKMDTAIHLSYNNNNIHFEYTGISFRSGGEITYHYKLTGLDSDWKTTSENNLDYKSLPSGEYQLELYAVNKYVVKSDTITIHFSIATPFWKTWWFYLLTSLSIITGIVFIFNARNKRTRQRLEERNNFQKQFATLEQQALQSQMNPHFIFNCLNSIQQYIVTNDKEKANQYLTGFASLIRQTLDISAQQSITVAEEVSYLQKYLDMERMRFGDSFKYTIIVNSNVKADYIQLPALLLQPYVENSLRHGIRYKTDGKGEVAIGFSMKGNTLQCSIKDNGIGRLKAAEFKSKQHIEYQSKGMQLTSKRIGLLNAINENKITVMVTDLMNNDTAAGTLVEINIPH